VSTHVSSPQSAVTKACIDACTDCHHVCLEVLSSFLQPGGPELDTERYQLLADCAEICEISANFMLSASTRSHLLCGICAPLCDETAESCATVRDDRFAACAATCRRAAAACREVAEEAGSART
jgi:hypothetical protein